ncbi:MAG TPA: 2-oxoglutarate dehydrogenase E1 component [Prolixibacteraceae bacterium]|nr:2-oxoglutarate dehydrogenase E1 component [Prolixibacteraceae bacterium]
MDKFSQVGNQEAAAIEELYSSYLIDPESIDASWKNFFAGFEFARKNFTGKESAPHDDKIDKEFAILNLIHGYRQRGHLFTKTNPVRARRQYTPTLDIENFGLQQSDLDTVFKAGNNLGIGPATLRVILEHLEATYCQSIGVEYVYMRKPELVEWLRGKMESTRNSQVFTPEQQHHIYYHLKVAVGFENFIHKKFVGQKRFSLEGGEALIPALDAVIEHGAEMGIAEFVIGMAHRGRLNVLTNILEKPYAHIFKEYVGTEYDQDLSLGDVKYHLGYENDVKTDNGKSVRLSLVPNPSHLETVASLVQGMARSRIDSRYNEDCDKVAPIVIHGDAAIAAQGIVYEVIQMSQLAGYKTGGTIHLIINNQVGFTTNYLEARSSTYCTDVAKVTRSPVFHVNGDDVEAIIFTVKLAMEFRQEFNSDVFIDILCYRKYGHNEGDEPRFTQPLLYKEIEKHPNPRDIYATKLAEAGVLTKIDAVKLNNEFDQFLEEKYKESEKIEKVKVRRFLSSEYTAYHKPTRVDLIQPVKTGVKKSELLRIAERINTLPGDRKFFKKISRIVEDRRMMILDNRLDWAMAELLAYGTLLEEGSPIRLSGQDTERGTFAHRHAAFVVEDTDDKYFPLNNLSDKQAPFRVYNSHLSEYGVLGFEYGYALANPKALTIWEAQFGDFANVAQVIFDQYISSAYEKWGMMNSLVLYLPHGYEGQGPEHSSGRIERALNLTADNNIQVVVPTTPANMFHVLRRQLHWKVRIPLIIFTPKSLLRHPMVNSSLEELAEGSFQEIIEDTVAQPAKIKKVVFTFGKLYYDLHKRQAEEGIADTTFIRVEQLFPLAVDRIRAIIGKYPNAEKIIWAQDEPANMGAWQHIQRFLPDVPFQLAARPASASPAVGLMYQHNLRLKALLDSVFGQQPEAKGKGPEAAKVVNGQLAISKRP